MIAAWLLLVVILQFGSKALGGSYSDDFSLPGTSAQTGSDLLAAHAKAASGSSGQLVFRVTSGSLAEDKSQIAAAVKNVSKLSHVNSVSSPFASSATVASDGRIAYSTIHFDANPSTFAKGYVSMVDTAVRPATEAHIAVSYGGSLGQAARPPANDIRSEGIGILVAIAALLVAFGSLAAAGFPILNALFGVVGGLGLLGIISSSTTFASVSPTLAAMIGIGVGIDYALFLSTRFRQQIMDGVDPIVAAGRTTATSGRAVAIAAVTVIIALLGLYAGGVQFIGRLGLAAGITVAISAISALTLVPALLGLAGRRIDRLRIKHPIAEPTGTTDGWHRYAVAISRHPWRYTVAGVIVLGILAIPLLSIRLGHVDAGADPSSYSDRQAYDSISTGFGPGANGPLTIVVKLDPRSSSAPASLAAKLATSLPDAKGVASVGPIQPTSDGALLVTNVIPTTSPSAAATEALITRLTDTTLPTALKGTGAASYVTGATAEQLEFTSTLASHLPLVIGVVIAAAFLILLAAFRSVFVAVKAAILNLLSIGASYGVLVAVFQWGWGGPGLGVHGTVPIESYVPMIMFAIVFGLSMDYEVFLLSRIREAWLQTGDNRASVAVGLAATGRVITAAAIIMTSVFLAFLLSTNVTVKMLALGLGVSVIVDATIVRMVIVPAAMNLFPRANWWIPKWLDRVLPSLDPEGSKR
jgi:RND superfamily putative drug exporter